MIDLEKDAAVPKNEDLHGIAVLATKQLVAQAKVSELENQLDMCWLESSSLKKPLLEIYPKPKSDQIITKYLKFEKRWKLRKNLNSKIPLLGRFRFRSKSHSTI